MRWELKTKSGDTRAVMVGNNKAATLYYNEDCWFPTQAPAATRKRLLADMPKYIRGSWIKSEAQCVER